jgi:hypothetical protein
VPAPKFPLKITFTKSAGSRANHTELGISFKDADLVELGQVSQLFRNDAPVSELAGYIRQRFAEKLTLADLPANFDLTLTAKDVFLLLS